MHKFNCSNCRYNKNCEELDEWMDESDSKDMREYWCSYHSDLNRDGKN